jgi:hypothetical protein
MSAGADLGFKGTKGRRTLKVRMGNAYIPRLQAAAVTDGSLSAAFLRAAGLVDPPQALLHPSVVARVLLPRLRASREDNDATASSASTASDTSTAIGAGAADSAGAAGSVAAAADVVSAADAASSAGREAA